ncbi:MAG: hypothetical protein RLZZ362_1036 [Actinomycetota bacterium]
MKKKFVATGLVAGLIAGAGAGLVLQSTGFAGASDSRPAAISISVGDDAATAAGTDAGRPDRTQRLTEVLQPLVDSGTITADQMTAVVDALAAAGPQGAGDRGGRGDRGGHGDHGGRRGAGRGLDAAATALGVTADELRTELRGGQTIAQVATAKGVAVQTVVDAIVADLKARLDEAVASGEHTQAEADAKLTEATARITDMVNNGRPERADGPPPADTAGA